MFQTRSSRIAARILALGGAIFAVLFGITRWDGACLGDRLLSAAGIPPWSHGTHGTHYTALFALALLAGACGLFAATTRNKGRSFRLSLLAAAALLCLPGLISLIF